MKRNLTLAAILLGLVAVYYLGQARMENEVEENIKKESVKLFENFSIDTVKEISIANAEKGEKVEFAKEDDSWKVKGKDCNADKNSIDKILEKAPEIRLGEEIGSWQPEYMQKYGFDRGFEIKIGSVIFNFGKQAGSRIALKHNDKLYLSPFRDKYVFSKYDGNWCEKKKEEKPDSAGPLSEETSQLK